MDLGISEILIILLIVTLLFGPGRLVNLGKELGQGIREFRQGLQGSHNQASGSPEKRKDQNDATPK
jgi:sec-independent protein translocase protein TatA